MLFNNKLKILRMAYNNFDKDNPDFINFVKEGFYNDFALFMVLKMKNNFMPWYMWDESEKNYSPELEIKIITEHKDDYLFILWTQFEFLSEWNNLIKYAHKKGVQIMGDIPLYLNYDSEDVWKYPKLFKLDKNKNMAFVAGCPPDGFSPTGQLWGNPVYDWSYMAKDNYKWWSDRIHYLFKLYDYLRLDHFRGFDRYYEIKADAVDASKGTWEDGPKFELFKDKLDLKIVVEDLGILDEGVYKLMDQVKYPGMKILQEAFDGNKDNIHKPTNVSENNIIYTASHDGMPTQGLIDMMDEAWFNSFVKELTEQRQAFNLETKKVTKTNACKLIVELAYASKANYVIIPTQDILNQGADFRMNLPGNVSSSNWSYRVLPHELNFRVATRLRHLASRYER